MSNSWIRQPEFVVWSYPWASVELLDPLALFPHRLLQLSVNDDGFRCRHCVDGVQQVELAAIPGLLSDVFPLVGKQRTDALEPLEIRDIQRQDVGDLMAAHDRGEVGVMDAKSSDSIIAHQVIPVFPHLLRVKKHTIGGLEFLYVRQRLIHVGARPFGAGRVATATYSRNTCL
ncbi:MAG: hypothetical protein O3B01_30375 [Planctomycetota bacterium]|nr:hypothetical protein [Planctomycetota bacterium]